MHKSEVRSIKIDGLKSSEVFEEANALYCNKCGCLRDMTVETKSIETSANLAFYLTPSSVVFIPEDNIRIENNNYVLYEVICHIEMSFCWKWFAYTDCEVESSWVEYNDFIVSFVEKPNFGNAYMLFDKNKNWLFSADLIRMIIIRCYN